MFSNIAHDLGSAALDFSLHLGQIALVAILYLAAAYFIVRFVVNKLKDSEFLAKYGKNGSMIATRLIAIGIYLVAVVGVLSYMGVNTTGILTLASALTVAVGLALQDVMKNLISGLFLLAERPFSVGDRVTVRNQVGTVQGIDIRTTLMRTDDGSLLMVPNQLMFTEILQNNSRYNMRLISYRITTPLSSKQLTTRLHEIAEQLDSVRPPIQPLTLVHHSEAGSEWEVGFQVSSKQMTHDHEVGEALVEAFPDATIARVETE